MPQLSRIAVSMPDALKEYIDQRVTEGDEYASESDFIRQLVRKDRDHNKEAEAIRYAIEEGIAQADQGKFISHKSMQAYLDELTRGGKPTPPEPEITI